MNLEPLLLLGRLEPRVFDSPEVNAAQANPGVFFLGFWMNFAERRRTYVVRERPTRSLGLRVEIDVQ